MRKIDTDETLVSKLRKGDEKAFDVIYERYWERLYSYAYRRLSPADMAYELTQDVFVSLWARRDQLSIQVSLSGYLFGAMRNQIFKYINRSDVRARYLEDFLRFNQQRVDNSNQETIILHDLEQAVENSLSSLPARCQEIFRLSRYEHRSIREIADQLNISNRTVENQLHRALKHLKVELGDFMALAVFWWI